MKTREECLRIAKISYRDIVETLEHYKMLCRYATENDAEGVKTIQELVSRFDGTIEVDDYIFMEHELNEE